MKRLKQLLTAINIKLQPGKKHGLKCKQDPNAINDDPKPLKFRVELGTRPPRESDMQTDEVYVTFQLQSGYLEQFKQVNDTIVSRWNTVNK